MRDNEPPASAGVRRRSLLIGTAAGVGALTVGAVSLPAAEAATSYVKGADLSWVPQMEAHGYSWFDKNGKKRDILDILKNDYQMTAVRLRMWVNPSSDPASGHCSTEETAAFAKRCKAAGLQVMLSLHFGDTWNSVGHQLPPAAWASMTYSQMLTAMYNYVYHAMNVVKASGVSPTWIVTGNETNSGICHPIGTVSKPAQMTGLINAAYDMAKAVFPAALVGVHLAQPQNLASVENFLDKFKANGGKWDFTGLSSYASGANIAPVVANFKTIKSRYGKPVFHVEAGGPVAKATSTRDSLVQFITAEKSYGCMGILYWEPEGYSPFTDYDMVAWNSSTRRPTAALDAFNLA